MHLGTPSVARALARRLLAEAENGPSCPAVVAGLTIESDDGVVMEYTRHFTSGMASQRFVLDREHGTVEEL